MLRLAAVTLLALLALAVAPAAHAQTRCKSADLRYPFQPGGPKTFGVFELRVTNGSCSTAHRVAMHWMDHFEGNVLRGHVRLPRKVDGFRFTSEQPTEAQTFSQRGTRGATTIRFDYRVPNG